MANTRQSRNNRSCLTCSHKCRSGTPFLFRFKLAFGTQTESEGRLQLIDKGERLLFQHYFVQKWEEKGGNVFCFFQSKETKSQKMRGNSLHHCNRSWLLVVARTTRPCTTHLQLAVSLAQRTPCAEDRHAALSDASFSESVFLINSGANAANHQDNASEVSHDHRREAQSAVVLVDLSVQGIALAANSAWPTQDGVATTARV